VSLLFLIKSSILSIVEYILFAFLALLASAGNTIFNRLGANRASALANAVVKSFFIMIACFIICLALGHTKALYDIELTQWTWIIIVGILTSIDWLFYFLAIKKSHLEAFAPYCAAGILFFSNTLFLIFMFVSVTNGGKPLNIVLYFLGLVVLLGSLLFIIFNKKINPAGKWLWVAFATISVVSFAFVLLIAKLKLSNIPSDVISFHQISIVFIVMAFASVFTGTMKEVARIRWLDLLFIFVGAIFNALMMVFRYNAFAYDNCVPAIVNVIIGLDFIIVSIGTVLFFKEKNKLHLTILIVLVAAGMVLNVLAGLI